MTSGWKKQEKPKAKGSFWRTGALCALLLAAGVLVWIQGGLGKPGNAPQAQPEATPQVQPHAEKRGLREAAYEKDLGALATLSENQGVTAQIREDAAKQMQQMVAWHQAELSIDDALRAAGFSPVMTLMQNGALTVMVQAKELTGSQSATILSLCAAHADVRVENIRIMTGEPLGGQ